jgi:3-hydroxybutyryl-CoA dehydrogenase
VINECAFALGEGVGDAADIDQGMVLGLSYPRGPLEWADAIGIEQVMGVLEGLWSEYHEERYRAAPELRRRLAAARSGAPDAARFRGRGG